MEVAQLKKLKEMEAELAQYKRIVAEQSLQIVVLKDVIEKKLYGLPKKESWCCMQHRHMGPVFVRP